ncbi:glycosyl hydrolase family 76 [Sphingobacterium allocomposti]|uniref:Glycosyl hydrolase family 76 n=1 Tax=Sphingobacterium allocomposti TaxID=415956 RepID=A0A5S5DFH8_9SPHI|nr:glycoside hydrolase family 76 protein [Sphingobacterium composti Yoo et al. 2007 non Ten et al. 2007]TYP94691.1 glycosyl hydrolase family 76 [Sphingobacterium composti Yoo et al. 2007 non Ten et al. 2007]
MKKILYILWIGFIIAGCDDGSEPYVKPDGKGPIPTETVDAAARAKEIFDLINQYYKAGSLFKENYPAQPGDGTYSYAWPYDAVVSGASQLHQLGYDVRYHEVVNGFEKYYTQGAHGNNIGGYGSSTNGTTGGGTRFYDDNSIIGINLLEAYHITQDQTYIERAARILPFLKNGIDDRLGGALWWNEDYRYDPSSADANKPTCSNGYAALFLLMYYEVCPVAERPDVLALATELYSWLRNNLYDPDTKCYWNDKQANGTINTRLWTYNAAVMVQNGIRLAEITGNSQYLEEAKATAQGAYDYFVKIRNGVLSYTDTDPWFNTKLLRAYIDLAKHDERAKTYIDTYYNFINNGYTKARTDLGFFFEDWTGGSQGRYYSLLMQGAVVESYGALAIYRREAEE